jgi:hypothetical protein
MIFPPIAIVGAEVSSVRVEIAAVAIDVALILPDGLTGAAEARPILLEGGPVPRRPILLELLLVLSNGLPVAMAILPVGAEILLVLPKVAAVPAHVLAVLAQVALIASQLAPILVHLWIGNGSRRLCANARDPGGHRQRPGRCHGLPSIHVILQWVSDALHPSDAKQPVIVYSSSLGKRYAIASSAQNRELTRWALRLDSHTSSPTLTAEGSHARMRRLSGGRHSRDSRDA